MLSARLAGWGIFKASLFHSNLLLSDNQSLEEESKAVLRSSPWLWLTHGGILMGGKHLWCSMPAAATISASQMLSPRQGLGSLLTCPQHPGERPQVTRALSTAHSPTHIATSLTSARQ